MSPILQLQDVEFTQNGRVLLEGVTCQVLPGECFVLAGANSAGKTLFLKLSTGAVRPTRGRILLVGQDLSGLSLQGLYRLRRQVGFVFQNAALINNQTVRANIALPLTYHTRRKAAELEETVDRLLRLFQLEPYQHLRPVALTFAVKKRTALARALALDPPLLFLDDPLVRLDRLERSGLLSFLRQLAEDPQRTVVITTTALNEYLEIAHRVSVLEEGHLVFQGSPHDFHQRVQQGDERLAVYL